MYVIVVDDGYQEFYFAGWEGSDCDPAADEMTFWRPKVSDPEVFEFTDRVELKAEIELLKKTGLNFPIGIPDDFMYDEVAIDFIKIREHND